MQICITNIHITISTEGKTSIYFIEIIFILIINYADILFSLHDRKNKYTIFSSMMHSSKHHEFVTDIKKVRAN
ncbi:hypothetical protein DAQ1742_01275 [Dickeya aquatica]|uniref:Uncharacterized protein n=1 Tax=Dickeya aquatica TaxID=1401087 RepID=A0A375A8F7_9GAMM|nr:hypothetical protein DAQ1742_01275 [Dickeya aquatica]